MKFTKLTEKEFIEFSKNHPQLTFHQTLSWGKLKKKNNWIIHLVGIKENKKIIAGALLLEKNTPLKKSIFYSPRGFLLEYNDNKLLAFFTKQIKQYIKENNGFFLKIDPYISYQERDKDGNIVEKGYENKEVVENLKKLGYYHSGFTTMNETLQPRWMFVLNVKDKTIETIKQNFDGKTKRILKKNNKMMINVRELKKEELPIFKQIMQSTSNRREFVDRPFSYYENMYNEFHQDNHLKIMIAELPVNKYLTFLKKDLKKVQDEIKDREKRKETENLNETKYIAKQKEAKEKEDRTKKQIDEMTKLQKQYGNTIILGGMLFLLYGNEIVYLMGGSFKEFLHFQSAYTIHEYMIEYTVKNNYDNYNFYGITGVFDESNPLYGIYFSKKGFGGNVVELIGEFDLVVDTFYYYLYKCTYGIYHSLKNTLQRIKKIKS